MKPGVKKPTLGPTFPLENVHLRNVCETCSLLSFMPCRRVCQAAYVLESAQAKSAWREPPGPLATNPPVPRYPDYPARISESDTQVF